MTLLLKPAECLPCPLFGSGKGFSRPDGRRRRGVLIVGDSLGDKEERRRRSRLE